MSMQYNTTRPKMIIPEYGRHIQKLIDHAIQLEKKEERNEMALAIIDVMGQLNPHLRDVDDFKHKLWDHIFIMSNFKLDVESPYPIPSKEQFEERPNKMPYPANDARFKHYGKGVEELIGKAIEFEDGEEKEALILAIGNLMKRHYLTWGRSSVNDGQIIADLKKISRGKLEVSENLELIDSKEISPRKTSTNTNTSKNKKRSKRTFKGKKNTRKDTWAHSKLMVENSSQAS